MLDSTHSTSAETHQPHAASRRDCLGWGLLSMTAGLPGLAQAAPTSPAKAAELPTSWPGTLAALSPVTLPDSHRMELRLGGQNRRIDILLPPGPAPADGYPVLYVLDGNALAAPLAALVRTRAARPDGASTGPVVVGLGYAVDGPYDLHAREQDDTLPLPDAPLPQRTSDPDTFLDVIASLQAWLRRQLPIDPRRQTLFGHSYGGLLTLHALFTRPQMFQNWVAASPSIWWGDGAILTERDRFLQQARPAGSAPARLLVTSGSLEEGHARPAPPNADPARAALRAARQRQRQPVTQARELVQSLQAHSDVQAEFLLLEGEDHGSAQWPAMAQALRWAMRTA